MLRPNRSRQLFLIALLAAAFVSGLSRHAMAQSSAASEASGVPRQIQFSGQLPATGAQSVTFALYTAQDDSSPEWLETQNVLLDADGRFTASLGSTSPDGLPQFLFTDNSARWLGVRLNHDGAPEQPTEQPRVLLMSVPYALKAGDAETLGGLPASAFVPASAYVKDAAGPAPRVSDQSPRRQPSPMRPPARTSLAQARRTE